MKYPINYDFGKNWKTEIVPFLEHPKIKRTIARSVNSFHKYSTFKKKYIKNTAPASYSTRDYYSTLVERKEEIIMDILREIKLLPKEFLKLEKKVIEHGDYCVGDDDDDIKLYEMQQRILKPFFSWESIKYNLETYYFSGACHWWAPTFELELAKLVEPNIKWKVKRGFKHTTVISTDNSRVFDLLYWVSNSRIENYMFDDPIKDKQDETLGGKAAYLDSLTK